MAAQYRIDIGHFDGLGGSLAARSFVHDVDNAIAASGVTPERMAGIVRGALRGAARAWIETAQELGTAGLASWTTLKPLFTAEFGGQLTVAELASLERQLEHKPAEKVSNFYVRCQRYHLEEDSDLTADVKADDIYKEQFTRRVKFSFMKGLRQEIRMAMAGVNVQTSTVAALLTAAKNAEILVMKKSDVAPSTSAADPKKQEIDALQASLSDDGRAILAMMEHRFGRGGKGKGGKGGRRGKGRGGPPGLTDGGGSAAPGPGRRAGPSLEVLRAREKALCHKCQKWVKHRANECFVGQDSAPAGGAGRGGGGNTRSYANAAGAAGDPGAEFQVFDYSDPLN